MTLTERLTVLEATLVEMIAEVHAMTAAIARDQNSRTREGDTK